MNITIGANYTINFNGAPMYAGQFTSVTPTGGMFVGTDLRPGREGQRVETGIAWECEGRTIVPA
jgi:hypothetical protein